jgi:phosphoribosylformylglycinamidine cyclo-ligase
VPPLFSLIQQRGGVGEVEMYRTFNMGIGMVVIAAADRCVALQQQLRQECWQIGEVILGSAVELV